MTFLLGHVDFLTARAVDLDPRCPDIFAHTNRKYMLPLAEYAWTYSKYSFNVLLSHDGKSFGGDDVSGVDETVDISCLLVDGEVSKSRGSYLSSSSYSS